MKFYQACPNCGAAVPLRRAFGLLGRPFNCRSCGKTIIIDKNYWIPLAGIGAFFRFKSETDSMLEHAVLLVGIMAVVQLLTMIFMQPKIHLS